ncbi:hypothetical protein QYM36_003432 [Artemia franciscana]|nr:hypothetical protein QYM36_003432 [Artemia franciscana]
MNIGGCDFSSRLYTYADLEGDITLSSFALQEEDLMYKIPMIKRAQTMSNREIKLIASAWSAPAWMKSNNALYDKGYLLPEYWQVWADYILKFLDSYAGNGIHFWGITPQNEPINGNIPGFTFNCMGWNATTQTNWVAHHFGPTLWNGGYSNLSVMIMDDQRFLLPGWAETVVSNPEAEQYVSGIAVHWYFDRSTPPSFLDETHNALPDYFILSTEACAGDNIWEDSVALGSWDRAEDYMHDIIEDLNHWVVGWIDWNLALNPEGGPNWAENFVDSPIIVNATADEFYRNPMFYAMAHVSKFVTPGSIRIETMLLDSDLECVGFERLDGSTVILILNRSEEDELLIISDGSQGNLEFAIPKRSIHTVIY